MRPSDGRLWHDQIGWLAGTENWRLDNPTEVMCGDGLEDPTYVDPPRVPYLREPRDHETREPKSLQLRPSH